MSLWFVYHCNVTYYHFLLTAGKPLFPGTSTLDQIERIMTIIPTPSRQGKLKQDLLFREKLVILLLVSNKCNG